MNQNNKWKWLLVAFLMAWAVREFTPPAARDIITVFEEKSTSRDTNFTAIVERARKLQEASPKRAFANLREAVGTNDLTRYFDYNVTGEAEPSRAILNRLQRESAGKIKLGLDLQGGSSFLVALDTNKLSATVDKQSLVNQAVEVLRKRVDKFGVAEPLIVPAGDDRVLLQMPGISDAERQSIVELISKPAFLEFRMVHPESERLVGQGLIAPGYELLKTKQKRGKEAERVESVLVKIQPERGLTGKYIKNAGVYRDPVAGRPQIHFKFTDEGGKLFADITREHVNHRLGIVLDGELYSAPNIVEPILGGSGQITGDFDTKEAFELANVLENPLEAPVKIIAESSVDPSLGADAIKSGVTASLAGTLAVCLFMIVYYRLSGVIANIALISNIVILIGVMCSVGTTLTLPGIAGIVLTIGMAVDANVLIYERLREELAKGKSLRGAIIAGYDRAFSTIFDSHVTTLISSVILIYLGTGSVKGFGVALTIGVSASLFTALVVTRLIFDFALARNWISTLTMLHVIRDTKIDFMKLARPAFIASWLLIVVGIGYGFHRGQGMFGVDFKGGDTTIFSFEKKDEIEKLRAVVAKAGENESLIQFQSDMATGKETLRVTTAVGSGDKVAAELKKEFATSKLQVIGQEKVGAVVGKESQSTALWAVVFSLFGILVYVAFRYEFSFAIGAVVAVLHDVLMTIGCYCLTGLFAEHGRQFNATMVAAVLTIIGFSINDTIVIFDRIREDLKLGVHGSFKDILNRAVNETLSRTIITSGTVFLATLSLYLFGGGVINDFAFTFLVGIITGTYSSIYIASAMVWWWHKGERPTGGAAGSAVRIDNQAVTERV